MATSENSWAGQGSVVLDIGGDIGALVVTMPAWMEDIEVEIVPSGSDARQGHHHDDSAPALRHGHEPHRHGHESHSHSPVAPPHVAVVARPLPDGSTIHSLVYGELSDGTYDLYVRPDGPVQLTATVAGGAVTEAVWPTGVTTSGTGISPG